jgi:hypothetical protein
VIGKYRPASTGFRATPKRSETALLSRFAPDSAYPVTDRTQEVAGSSPASSMKKAAGNSGFCAAARFRVLISDALLTDS